MKRRFTWSDRLSTRILAPGAAAVLVLLGVSLFLHGFILSRAAERGASEVAAYRVLPALQTIASAPKDERTALSMTLSGPDIQFNWSLEPSSSSGSPISGGIMDQPVFKNSILELRAALELPKEGLGPVQDVVLDMMLPDQSWLSVRVQAVSLLYADDLAFRIACVAVAAMLILLAAHASRVLARPLAELAKRARLLPADGVLQVDDIGGPMEVREVSEALQLATGRTAELLRQRSLALGALSHDLMSPLTRLRLRADDIADPALRQRILHDLSEMIDMVSDVLAYLRGKDGGGEPASIVSISSLVQVIIDEFAEEGKVIAERVMDHAPVRAQPVALKRAIRNVLGNATKYGIEPWVAVECREETVHIWVGDQGDGLAPEDIERVFEPFFRADTARAAGEGSGLGLPTARAIVEAQGGRLALTSKQGVGTEVEIRLPLHTQAAIKLEGQVA
jgi:signal transduction histidine kinase